ncbi:MAG: glycosyl hydrolase [Anaerolineae bacterium]
MSNRKILLGTRKGFYLLQENGQNWEVIQSGLPGIPVQYGMRDHRSGTYWFLTDQGHWGPKLYASHDEGASLEDRDAPKYPDGSTMFDIFSGGKEVTAATSYLWTLTPGGEDRPGQLFIGTEPGALFQSDDDGQSFTINNPLWNHHSREKNWFGGGRDQAGCCSIIVDPRDSNHIYAGVSIGGVYESFDGGESWEGRNKGLIAEYKPDPYSEYGHDPHYLQMAPSNPDVLWMQNHCGVFRSGNGGASWDNISEPESGIKFGFPIVAAEDDDQTAWVIPAISDDVRMAIDGALFVARTTDGGKSWEQQRIGLPQSDCYDVVFRHGLDLRGDTLVFGTTTGNLYLSNNRGDQWLPLGHHFPPIYSVRFV